ncbi:MAG: ABC transporter ATP-binding protein [Massilia sp.]
MHSPALRTGTPRQLIQSPALRFERVVKRFGRAEVLAGIDLEIGAGELFGLVGVNGAGKTSLIKCLLDFTTLDGGAIEIFGRPHTEPAARAPLAFLPEHFQPPWYMRGAEFLRHLLKLRGLPWRQEQVAMMLDALDLDPDALSRPVRAYSKGMTQKLGLAATLLTGADALVLDEPMSGLDPKARALFKVQLQLQRARGATVFFSSHALADVAELCDRMAILHAGRIAFAGTPGACLATYGADNLEQAFLAAIQ